MLEWDIANPDNQPEDFAVSLANDLQLQPQFEWVSAIGYEIRKQIMIYCCQKVQTFNSFYENYVSTELEVLNQMQTESLLESVPPNNLFAVTRPKIDSELINFQIQNEAPTSTEKVFSLGRFTDLLLKPTRAKEDSNSDPPSFLEFDELFKKTPEQLEIKDNIMYAEIALKHEVFQPKPLAAI
jgi:hypothetical protein